MLDDQMRRWKDQWLGGVARSLHRVQPTSITLLGFGLGLLAVGAIVAQQYGWGLAGWWLNRLLDGLDGTLARVHQRQSDLGGYLDILCDFVLYALLPLALVVSAPSPARWLALALLLASFYVNAASWMMLAAILAKRGTPPEQTTVVMPPGLIGGTETILFYTLFLLFPGWTVPLFLLLAALVALTVGQRLVWAVRHLAQSTSS